MSAHPHRTRRGPVTGLTAVLLAALLGGCSAEPVEPTMTSGASTAAAPGGLVLGAPISLPDLHVPGRLQVVAGTADRFIIAGDGAPGRYSADNGRTWQELPAEVSVRSDLQRDGGPSFGSHIGYQGTFAGLVPVEGGAGHLGLQRWNPDTGDVTFYPYPLPETSGEGSAPLYPVDYVGTALVLSDGRILRFVGSDLRPLTPAFAATARQRGLRTAVTKDGATAVRMGYSETGNYGYLNIASTDGKTPGKAYRVDGLLAMDVSAFTIHYLTGTSTDLRACRANVDSPLKASCKVLARGDYRRSRYDARLTTSIGAAQVYLTRRGGGGVRQWMVREGRVSAVGSTQRWQWLPFRDSGQPMALVDRAGQLMAAEVSRDGTPTPLFTAPAIVARAQDAVLSTGRVSYLQESFTAESGTRPQVWTRTVGDGQFGPARRLTERRVAAVSASGVRTVTQRDRTASQGATVVDCYDGDTWTGSVEGGRGAWLRTLSGPYALTGDRVVRVDGTKYDTGPVMALFGSLAVEASTADETAQRRFQVRDLARPDAEPVPLDLPQPAGRVYRNDGWAAWNDWIVAGYQEGGGYDQLVVNRRRTGTIVAITGEEQVVALGDSWVVVTTGSTAELRRLDGAGAVRVASAIRGRMTTDGMRTLAWTDDAGTHVAEVSGLAVPAPRLLGAVGTDGFSLRRGTWRPAFDLSAAVAAGAVEIRRSMGESGAGESGTGGSGAGELVRTLPTEAGPQGSIRGVVWDGKDASGAQVRPGTYRWTLVAEGPDGGTVTNVDGTGPASGTIEVTR
ncbi:MAG: hypothetical protein QM619_00645 [Micropruina sp.]|uniref:hypothetical protein n=1 Tax=Micropruina sp. TaxID=2737536 RepID=UPI0039E6416C